MATGVPSDSKMNKNAIVELVQNNKIKKVVVSQIKVHFRDIGIISLFYPKNKNPTLERLINYEIYNNKRIAPIYTKINHDCIKLI